MARSKMRCRRLICSCAALAVAMMLALLPGAGPAQAAFYSVTRFDDPAPNGCNAGDCSLREAIIAANASTMPPPAAT